MKFMDAFEAFANKSLVPVAAKLNSQRHISAIRDSFILAVPLTMTGAMMVMINAVFLSPTGQFSITKSIFPGLAELMPLFSAINQGTVNCLSIFVAFLVARNLVKGLGGDDLLAGLTSLGVFFSIYPSSWVTSGRNEAGETITNLTVSGFQTRWFSAQGLFVAILFGLLVGELFAKLTKAKALQIRLPDGVPPAVARSFMALLPIAIILMICSAVNFLFVEFTPAGVHQFIYDTISAPLQGLGQSIWTIAFLNIMSNVLWLLGIHGSSTLNPITTSMFSEAAEANLNFVDAGGDPFHVPYSLTYNLVTVFATIGGGGMTIGLLIAIFLVSKREDYKTIAKLSLAPGIFNINESVTFGIPLVLNPIFMIPFVLAPVTNLLIGYAFVATKMAPFPWNTGAPWTSPAVLLPFLAMGGHWMGAVIGVINLAVATIIYLPFVILSNKQIDTE